jgi:hypothetical protein
MYREMLIACAAIIAIPALPVEALADDGKVSPATVTAIDAIIDAPDTGSPIVGNATAGTASLTEQPAIPDVVVSELVASALIETLVDDNAVTDDDLLQLRGGQAIVVGNQTLTAVTNGTFNGNYAAGSVTLADNALSNFNGLGNLVINTGAQNNLQSAMNVTINFSQ